MAMEWSLRSFMLVEYAERISAIKHSSAMDRSPLAMISSRIGSNWSADLFMLKAPY